MSHYIRRVVAALSLFSLGCVVGDEGYIEKNEPATLSIVFDADYLDIYGPIEIRVDGYEPILLDRFEQFSCEDPSLVIPELASGAEIEFSAYSYRHFVWREVLPSQGTGEGCIVVKLGYENLLSGIEARAKYGAPRCFPEEFYLAFGGQEEKHVGTIRRPFNAAAEIDFLLPRAEFIKTHLDAAREEKLVVWGGGDGWIFSRFRSEEPCGRSEGTGISPPQVDGYRLISTSIGSD